MMKYSFFNSVYDAEGVPDRPFDANDFSKYFGTLIKDGVFPNPSTNFQVMGDQGSMQVRVQPGLAWIQGHLGYDDSSYLLDIDVADSVMDRIDRIVIRMDTAKRDISLQVKKGDMSAQPVAKELQRDADAWELGIADIRVSKGMAAVSQSAITDLRQNTQYCGLVTGTVTQIDTSTFMNQLEKWKEEYIEATNQWTDEQERLFLSWKQAFETDANEWKTEQEGIFIEWSDGQKTRFNEWFEQMKDQLSTDAAGNLQKQVDALVQKDKDLDAKDKELDINKMNVPTQVEYTMQQSKWSGNVYSFESDYPFDQYTVYVLGATENTTTEQKNALDDADLRTVLTNQTVVAKDITPKIDIIVGLEVVKKNVNS